MSLWFVLFCRCGKNSSRPINLHRPATFLYFLTMRSFKNARFKFGSIHFVLCGLLAAFLFAGCGTPKSLRSRADLDALTQRHGMGHLYYIGTEDGFHYFARKYFTERTKYYRLAVGNYSFSKPFPKTADESKWVPYQFDLNANTKGFRGELQQSLQVTNITSPPSQSK
jgi:hypothetical protein